MARFRLTSIVQGLVNDEAGNKVPGKKFGIFREVDGPADEVQWAEFQIPIDDSFELGAIYVQLLAKEELGGYAIFKELTK